MADNVVRVGQEILLNIKRIGINGEGIGYYKRLAIFVNGALPGEDAVVNIVNVYEKYAEGVLVRIKGEKNSNRIEPKCPYFNVCGGCQFQHIAYDYQLQLKGDLVKEAFTRYYNSELNPKLFKNTIGMDDPWRYRNKAKLPVRYDGEKLVVGLYAADSNKLVYIDDCLVEKQDIREILNKILGHLTKYQVIAYNPKLKDGVLRHIVLRSSNYSKDVQVTLILYKDDKRTENIAKDLINIPHIESVYISINADLEAVENFGDKTYLVAGKETIVEKINDFAFELLPTAFFQLNLTQTAKLYEQALKYAHLDGSENVVDAYCGVGTIGTYFSKKAKEVRGIDFNEQAIINANNNVKLNNISNAKFYSGNVLSHLSKWERNGWTPDVLVVDPPRTGLDLALINYLQNHSVKKIIYVSCNPATLAKNCNHLQKMYKINAIQPLDMFPHTSNVECVVSLERR